MVATEKAARTLGMTELAEAQTRRVSDAASWAEVSPSPVDELLPEEAALREALRVIVDALAGDPKLLRDIGRLDPILRDRVQELPLGGRRRVGFEPLRAGDGGGRVDVSRLDDADGLEGARHDDPQVRTYLFHPGDLHDAAIEALGHDAVHLASVQAAPSPVRFPRAFRPTAVRAMDRRRR